MDYLIVGIGVVMLAAGIDSMEILENSSFWKKVKISTCGNMQQ